VAALGEAEEHSIQYICPIIQQHSSCNTLRHKINVICVLMLCSMFLSKYVVKLSPVRPDNLRPQPHSRSPLVRCSPRSPWTLCDTSTTTTKPLSAICLSTKSSQSSRACSQTIFYFSRIRARRSPAAQHASRSTRSRNRQTAQQRTQPQNLFAPSQLAPRAGAIRSNR
jgi:hypothetical protein